MKNILEKMFMAKKMIAETKEKKLGKNSYSNYDYFTPEQVKKLVDTACFELKILTQYYIKDMIAYLDIYDIESQENLQYSIPVEIPEIKATNGMQRIGGVVTYSERYLKMTAFGIVDNNLEFDTTENTIKTAKKLPELLPNTDSWQKVISAINNGYTIEDIEKKYYINKTNKKLLNETV